MSSVSSPDRPSVSSARGTATEIDSENECTTKTTTNGQVSSEQDRPRRQNRVPAITRRLLWQFSGFYCHGCGSTHPNNIDRDDEEADDNLHVMDYNLQALATISPASPLVLAPMLQSSPHSSTIETVLSEYVAACRFYGANANAGILTSLRFALPCLRTSDHFHDTDMLALVEVLLRHCNGPLRFVKRLDFSFAPSRKEDGARGFQSHGAVALAKVLQISEYVTDVRLPRNSIGPYGASAIFLACAQNPSVRSLGMRRCRVGERGALVLAQLLQEGTHAESALREVDLSANYIGRHGCAAIEQAVSQRNVDVTRPADLLVVDLEGNLVFQEIMNAFTHGLGLFTGVCGVLCHVVESDRQAHISMS